MTKLRRIFIYGGLVASTVGVQGIWAAGCTNSSLLGLYNAEVQNTSLQSVLQGLNATPAGTGAGTGTGTGTGTTTPTVVAGLGGNPNSLSGNLPGLGRYYFDGAGNIVGSDSSVANQPATTIVVGTYAVNNDCSGRITLNSGATYDLALFNRGTQTYYVRTDAGGGGDAGTLSRATSCLSLSYPGNFSYFVAGGNKPATASTGGGTGTGTGTGTGAGTGTGSGTGAAATTTYSPYSAIGTISLDGAGNFALSQSVFSGTSVQRAMSSGTYTVGQDCSLSLKFATATGASSTNFTPPMSFRILMVDSTMGQLSIQPDSATTLTGSFTAQ